jgi:glycosyltransferase involved in cell wall biosynthesis
MLAIQRRRSLKLRTLKYWVQHGLYLAPAVDRPALESADRADAVVVCSPPAREHLCRFFAHYLRRDLCRKVVAIPYPIDECYLREPVEPARADRMIAVARWDDPQKDAKLLGRAIAHYLDGGAGTDFLLVGPGGAAAFEPLLRRHPKVRYLGAQPPEVVARLMKGSRALVLSSVWESGPIVLNEALACGCSVVGTRCVPSVVSTCQAGPFGTLADRRSPRALAAAMRTEAESWQRGARNPTAIAGHWRPLFDPVTVGRRLLRPLNKDDPQ